MSAPALLDVQHIEVVYDGVILAVRDVDLQLQAGEIVALLGANGAGKSTTLKAISGLVQAERGSLTQGKILLDGEPLDRVDPATLAARGLVQVLEGRRCFGHLSVEENLLTGGWIGRPTRRALQARLDRVYTYFPRLRDRRHTLAGYTSGGEQQMVALGRALMAQPRLILLDEPSMGLAPKVVEDIFAIVADLNQREQVSFLIAEQNAAIALHYASRAYVLETGRVTAQGSAATLRGSETLEAMYLGGEAA